MASMSRKNGTIPPRHRFAFCLSRAPYASLPVGALMGLAMGLTMAPRTVLAIPAPESTPAQVSPSSPQPSATEPAQTPSNPTRAPTPQPSIGHYPGRFSMYLGSTSALAYGGGVIRDIERTNTGTLPVWSSQEDFAYVYFANSKDGRPRISPAPGRHLSFSLGLSDHWAVSLDADDRRYVAHGYSTSYIPLLFYTYTARNSVPASSYPALADSMNRYYTAYRSRVDILRLVTLGGSLEYHPRSRTAFDPYVNAGYHQGREMMALSRLERLHAGAGIRYFYLDHFFVRAELSLQHYWIQRSNDGGGMQRAPVDGSLNEGRAELGLGVAIPELHLPDASLWTSPRREDPVELRRIVEDLKQEKELELKIRDGRITVILPNEAVFPSGSDEMAPHGKRVIERLSHILSRTRKTLFTVEGHTDNEPIRTGSRFASNEALSEVRAEKIRALMAEAGMPVERIHVRGYGASRPRRPNTSPANRALNRRIEIVADESLERYPELLPLLPSE